MTDSTYKERVARGAQWLDCIVPGWEQRIDVETLELVSAQRCICGQLFAKEAFALARNGEYYSGFSYAKDTLFSEAISWLRSTYGVSQVSLDPSYDESQSPRTLIAGELGFAVLYSQDTSAYEERDEEMNALEAEWRLLLAERAKRREELAQQLQIEQDMEAFIGLEVSCQEEEKNIEQEVESHDEARREKLVGANA
jgi:hypothetical protein